MIPDYHKRAKEFRENLDDWKQRIKKAARSSYGVCFTNNRLALYSQQSQGMCWAKLQQLWQRKRSESGIQPTFSS
jgi:hypothetical protein